MRTPEQLAREVRATLIGFYGTEDSSRAVLAALVRTLGITEEHVRLLQQSARDERAGVTADGAAHPTVASLYDELATITRALLIASKGDV